MIIIIQGLEHLAPLSGRPGSQGLLEPHSAQSQETRWPAWNLVRVATSTPAFGLAAQALVLCGRAISSLAGWSRVVALPG